MTIELQRSRGFHETLIIIELHTYSIRVLVDYMISETFLLFLGVCVCVCGVFPPSSGDP